MADNKYFNSKIYKIVCNITGDIYIGSSYDTLEVRLGQHKYNYKRFMECGYHFISSFKIIEKQDYTIELICSYPCENNTELRKEEQRHIDMNECVNIKRAYISEEDRLDNMKEYYQDNKDKVKECRKKYQSKNKDKIKETKKIYYTENKDNIKEYNKEYYTENKDKIKEKTKEYQSKNKDKVKECRKKYQSKNKEKIKERTKRKITCDCGSVVRFCDRHRHYKTKKHINFINQTE
jgi:hypothetical protein